MILRATLVALSMSVASPAVACMVTYEIPSREDLRALQALSKHIATEKDIKSRIDASVWGVFLDHPREGLKQNGYSRFKVGGVSKGNIDEVIRVVSTQRDIELGTQIHYLNLRKLNDSRWTDVGVTQQELDWGPEACEISPNASRCKLHQLKQDQIKSLCYDFISELYAGCLNTNSLPNICRQHIASAREALRVTPH